jgi:hypothetical protein
MNFINSSKVSFIFWNLKFKRNTKHTDSYLALETNRWDLWPVNCHAGRRPSQSCWQGWDTSPSPENTPVNDDDDATGHYRRWFEVRSNRDSILSMWASTPPPIGHQSYSGELNCGGAARPKHELDLGCTLGSKIGLYRRANLPWVWWCSRWRRLPPESTSI